MLKKRLVILACLLLVADLVAYKVVRSYDVGNLAHESASAGEFNLRLISDNLIVGLGAVVTDDGWVVCGTNKVPLMSDLPYVYICGENDIVVLRYSKRFL